MVIDSTQVPDTVNGLVKKSLTDAGFVPGNITIGQKDAYTTILVQLALTDDTQVQKVTDTLKATLIQEKIIASADNVLEQSII